MFADRRYDWRYDWSTAAHVGTFLWPDYTGCGPGKMGGETRWTAWTDMGTLLTLSTLSATHKRALFVYKYIDLNNDMIILFLSEV